MVLLPLLSRELRVQSRKPKLPWLRAAAAAVTCATFVVPVLLKSIDVANGRQAFLALSIFPLLFAVLTGIFTTADSISSERREGTLGLLLLTRVNSLELVLSKFCSGITQWSMCVCAVLPMFMLPLLMGGVTGLEVTLMMLLLIGTCCLSASIGLLVSCLVKSPVAATVGAFLIIFLWFVGGIAADVLLTRARAGFQISAPTLYVSLIFPQIMLKPDVAVTLAGLFIPSLTLLGLGALIIPRTLATQRPKKSRSRRVFRFLCIASVLLILVWIAWHFRLPSMLGTSATIGLLVITHTVLKLALTIRATRPFSNKRWLETVLTTPIQVSELLWIEFRSWSVAFAIASLLVALVDFAGYRFLSPGGPSIVTFYLPLMLLLFLTDCLALCWTGLWQGAKHRTINQAAGTALTQVVLVPVALMIFAAGLGLRTATIFGAILLWTILALAIDALFGAAAIFDLNRRLRRIAAT